MADWIDETLIDPDTHLVLDGIKAGSWFARCTATARAWCSGLETELRCAPPMIGIRSGCADWWPPSMRTWRPAVLVGAGGGDGGLFAGITARYLALVATELPGDSAQDAAARDTARRLVLASAEAAWDNRQSVDGLPLFAAFWDRTAEVPTVGGAAAKFVQGAVNSSEIPERDLRAGLGMDAHGGCARGDAVR